MCFHAADPFLSLSARTLLFVTVITAIVPRQPPPWPLAYLVWRQQLLEDLILSFLCEAITVLHGHFALTVSLLSAVQTHPNTKHT